MSDTLAISAISSVVGLIGTIFTGVMVYFMAKLKMQADKAATEARVVAEKLAASGESVNVKLRDISLTTEATHKQGNSMYGRVLRQAYMLAKRVYEDSGSEADRLIMEVALRDLEEHEKLQPEVTALIQQKKEMK